MKDRMLIAWSGGKDSAMALYEITKTKDVEVAALLTTVTEGHDRISMHGVRRTLLVAQAQSLGLPLHEITIPQNCTDEIYERRMRDALEKFKKDRVETAVFGDLFLEDIRAYREERMRRVGMRCLFPLWGRPTWELAVQFVDLGFRAAIACVDTSALGRDFAGREYDRAFLEDLPANVDPCGENGEFHSFVYDGPVFKRPIPVRRGKKVMRDGRFYYCDLLQAPGGKGQRSSNRISPT